jgi:DNA-binding response OmpR family regulator
MPAIVSKGMKTVRIAILEDDPAQAHFAVDMLSGAGHVCHEFAKGDDLVRSLRRQTFDLMLLD